MSVSVIEIASIGEVRVLTLSSGPVNAQDVELLDELTDAVREQQRSGEGPLVLTGAGRAFSAGVDLNRVVEGGAAYTDRLIPALSNAFNAVFEFPGRRWPRSTVLPSRAGVCSPVPAIVV